MLVVIPQPSTRPLRALPRARVCTAALAALAGLLAAAPPANAELIRINTDTGSNALDFSVGGGSLCWVIALGTGGAACSNTISGTSAISNHKYDYSTGLGNPTPRHIAVGVMGYGLPFAFFKEAYLTSDNQLFGYGKHYLKGTPVTGWHLMQGLPASLAGGGVSRIVFQPTNYYTGAAPSYPIWMLGINGRVYNLRGQPQYTDKITFIDVTGTKTFKQLSYSAMFEAVIGTAFDGSTWYWDDNGSTWVMISSAYAQVQASGGLFQTTCSTQVTTKDNKGLTYSTDCATPEHFWVAWPPLNGWGDLADPNQAFSQNAGVKACLGNLATPTVDNLGLPASDGRVSSGCLSGSGAQGSATIDCDIITQYQHGTSHDSFARVVVNPQGGQQTLWQDWATLVQFMAEGNYLALHPSLYGGGPQVTSARYGAGGKDMVWILNSFAQLFVFMDYAPAYSCNGYAGPPQLYVDPL